MDLNGPNLPAAVFIWRGSTQKYRLKRDKDIIKNVVSSDARCFGLAGSDVINEMPDEPVSVNQLQPITNDQGQSLRFATATTADSRKIKDVTAKIDQAEPVIVATSYPNTARRELARLGIVANIPDYCVQSGGIEGMLDQYSEVDIIFELVQSGLSIKEAGLTILEDSIVGIDLMRVGQMPTTGMRL